MLEVLRDRSTSRMGEKQLSPWRSSFLGLPSAVALLFVISLGLIVAQPAGALHGMFTVRSSRQSSQQGPQLLARLDF